MTMARIARYGSFIVLGHLIILFLHAYAHVKLEVYASWLGNIFIITVIWLAPLLAMILLLRRRLQTGVALLVAAMFGSLLFGIYHHFIAISPDHVSHIPAGAERGLFQITAVLLAVAEMAGGGFGIWAWRALSREG